MEIRYRGKHRITSGITIAKIIQQNGKVVKKPNSNFPFGLCPNRKGQTIQKDGAQSHRPKLAVGLLSLVERLETKSQKLIWRLDYRSGAMRKVEV